MGQIINFSTVEINNILSENAYRFKQDIAGDNYSLGSPLSIAAGTVYNFVCNGNTRNYKVSASHITNEWDTVNNKMVFNSFLDTPMFVVQPNFTFSPSSATQGVMTFSLYVNETVPLLIDSSSVVFKGTAPEKLTGLITFYIGSETGFDIKNKGIIIKFSSTVAGDVYNMTLKQYHT